MNSKNAIRNLSFDYKIKIRKNRETLDIFIFLSGGKERQIERKDYGIKSHRKNDQVSQQEKRIQ